MNSGAKPLLRALAGESVWPPPVWLMRQAGRYLPEYRALRAQAADFIAFCTTPSLAAEATLQPVNRFGLDAAILFSDILILPWALGHRVEFKEGEGPVLPRLQDQAGLDALDPCQVPEAVAPVLETIHRVRHGLADGGLGGTTLIGFAGAPFTIACYMVEGAGSRDFIRVRTMAYREPELLARLLEKLTSATIDYLAAQVEAGAEALMLFDSWAGILPPEQFRRFVIEPAARIAAALKSRFPEVPVIGFPRLAGLMLEAYARETQVHAVGLDTSADPSAASALIPPPIAVQGNLDPLALVAGGQAMERATARILEAMRGRPFVFNLGHGIVPETPPENVASLVKLIRAA